VEIIFPVSISVVAAPTNQWAFIACLYRVACPKKDFSLMFIAFSSQVAGFYKLVGFAIAFCACAIARMAACKV
jgi:hypothetical protein